MYEAILSDDGLYNIPKKFTSRASQILEVYLKSLGVRMETVKDDKEYIMEEEHNNEIVAYEINNEVIFCTPIEMYYLKKIIKHYKKYIKTHKNIEINVEEAWQYIMDNISFDKEKLTSNIINLFKNNIEIFSK